MEDLVKHWGSFVCQDVPWELAASVIKGMESLCKGVDWDNGNGSECFSSFPLSLSLSLSLSLLLHIWCLVLFLIGAADLLTSAALIAECWWQNKRTLRVGGKKIKILIQSLLVAIRICKVPIVEVLWHTAQLFLTHYFHQLSVIKRFYVWELIAIDFICCVQPVKTLE